MNLSGDDVEAYAFETLSNDSRSRRQARSSNQGIGTENVSTNRRDAVDDKLEENRHYHLLG